MPLTLTLTEGVLPVGSEKQAVSKIEMDPIDWTVQSIGSISFYRQLAYFCM